MKNLLTSLLAILALNYAFANPPTTIKKTLNWTEKPVVHFIEGSESFEIWKFQGAVYNDAHPSLPYFTERFPLDDYGQVSVFMADAQYEPFEKTLSADDVILLDNIQFLTDVERDRRQYYGVVSFIPIRKTASGGFERLVSFELRLNFNALPDEVNERDGGTTTSVLSDGDIYKFAVTETGMHKLDFNFLKEELGIPLENIDPRTIKLYGNGGGLLPELIDVERADDLVENSIQIVGEEDGKFDSGDYLLFYGEGASKWIFDENDQEFNRPMNFYDTRNYYFIKISAGNGRRVLSQPSASGATYTATDFNDYMRYEKDLTNLLHDWNQGQGSGRHWYGDFYKLQTTVDYDSEFQISNVVANKPAKVNAAFAGRIEAGSGSARFKVNANGNSFSSEVFQTTNMGPTDLYASLKGLSGEFTPGSDQFQIQVEFVRGNSPNNEGWLDYIELNFHRSLLMNGDQLAFRNLETRQHTISNFKLGNVTGNVNVWDITDPLGPKVQQVNLSGTDLTFGANTGSRLKEFIAFNNNAELLTAEAVGQIDNQNIHGILDADFLIVYHKNFESEAERLANHRADHSNMTVELVEMEEVFNEFSSGRRDATAVRDLTKLIYDRTDNFKYLLLLGDGSYDFRNLNEQGNDYVIAWETKQSLHPITAFPSDDYFSLLSEGEGDDINEGAMDIAVGRLPVKSIDEAREVVDKIVRYDTSPEAFGDWRNRMIFVGDDEDGGLHTRDADGIAVNISNKNTNLNLDKVYLDAFKQESTPFGTRIPLATEALDKNMFKGVLALTYLGHGGAKGWTQERVLKITDILNWENTSKLPIFITATCSFSGYDNPGFTTGGEHVLLNPKGGAIALFTTVRAVYASANEELTRASVDTLFFKFDNKIPTIGEVLRISKNKVGKESNSRKFTLLGDPSMQLALPNYNVATTTINGKPLEEAVNDTLRALQKVTITGEVQDDFGNRIDNFQGIVIPTIFDKKVTYQTLAQDERSPVINFTLQKNIIFKGKASVKNGQFEFTFVIPKDINYDFGNGKISYYAFDESMMDDGAGSFSGITIGGTDPNALADDVGPKVDVFMNSEDFIFGGVTDENPVLLVKLEDDFGINVVGNSIGHDLTGVLDKESKNTYILNDFYEAELDDYTRGEVRFPLSDLAEGRHEVRVTAWDVANNSSEGYTEFIVAKSEEMALEQVLNYPNPFTTSTCFTFEHGLVGQELDVLIQVYTVSGRLVKTLEQRIFSTGSRLTRDNCIQWEGNDDFGDPLARGVYLYKVKVRGVNTGNAELKGESEFEKLVILK